MGLKSTAKQKRAFVQEFEDQRPGLAVRRVAARLLSAIVDARTSLDGLTDKVGGHPEFRRLDPRDQALVRAILVSALRRRGTISAILDACIDRPLPPRAAPLRTILHTGLTQILFLDVPDSAAVDLAVTLASGDPRTDRFAGLVNAVLRRASREKDDLLAQFNDPMLNMPDWLKQRLIATYGLEQTIQIAAAHQVQAPVDLTARNDAAAVAASMPAQLLPFGTVRLSAETDGQIASLPGFAEGEWWVQDAAASLPAKLFGDISGLKVADVCAAPGGKTAQLAAAGAKVTAVDISASRMKRLLDNFSRLTLPVETHIGDLRSFNPSEPFDAVLLDAPCSSTGTIRRHPDVAYTKDEAEVRKLAQVQAGLLRDAARLVRNGGVIVFSNCSLDPVEGEEVVAAFLAERRDFERLPVQAHELPGLEEAICANGDVRTTPAMFQRGTAEQSGLDGFYAARLRRLA
ncbi:RsmB/NOP family class I SAM-dependent RNA methyltransferase [Aureimonas fodinaquatilis]|uniref:RsmB/NOP family class I SAM-dependent RNA methyltransferase n=1 Tax=Aureimonas fodinaquatilis TaxID=2565783 RepID=A0A5B0DRU2_9HYPH|nr:RsmB/NOP family class I SAM-dependent RNA methyltransferase [Aureimonas fodinaquatilis]KAA0968260.1 RsmB/NOP family class I SAM-dependent RNA methyltransferase [Aureimonas fodinaquatilis]